MDAGSGCGVGRWPELLVRFWEAHRKFRQAGGGKISEGNGAISFSRVILCWARTIENRFPNAGSYDDPLVCYGGIQFVICSARIIASFDSDSVLETIRARREIQAEKSAA